MLHIVPSCNLVQLKENLMNQIWENVKKPNFGPNYDPLDRNLGLKIDFLGFTSTRC